METNVFYITSESLIKLGIDPKEGIEYLENKKAITINPVHVRALLLLKQKPAVASS
jgi:hypothetical protein